MTSSSADTERIAMAIGAKLQGGECFELSSDLGGGKTTFTRGLAAGAGSADQVSSPTFTISKVYDAADLRIYHYDFYRLQDPGLVAEELAESIEDPNAVSVIEWAQTVGHVLPESRVQITIERQKDGEDVRKLTIEYPEELAYLLEGIE